MNHSRSIIFCSLLLAIIGCTSAYDASIFGLGHKSSVAPATSTSNNFEEAGSTLQTAELNDFNVFGSVYVGKNLLTIDSFFFTLPQIQTPISSGSLNLSGNTISSLNLSNATLTTLSPEGQRDYDLISSLIDQTYRARHELLTSNGFYSPKAEGVIVGAGPVGLVTAIQLAMRGVKVNVIEKRSDYSRGQLLILQRATLLCLSEILGVETFGKLVSEKIIVIDSDTRVGKVRIRHLEMILSRIAFIISNHEKSKGMISLNYGAKLTEVDQKEGLFTYAYTEGTENKTGTTHLFIDAGGGRSSIVNKFAGFTSDIVSTKAYAVSIFFKGPLPIPEVRTLDNIEKQDFIANTFWNPKQILAHQDMPKEQTLDILPRVRYQQAADSSINMGAEITEDQLAYLNGTRPDDYADPRMKDETYKAEALKARLAARNNCVTAQ